MYRWFLLSCRELSVFRISTRRTAEPRSILSHRWRLFRRLKNGSGLTSFPRKKIYEIYSMTECVGVTSIRGDEWLAHEGSVGRMPCGEIAIRDSEGHNLPIGETGEIFMSGAEQTKSYI